jgi:hypothetical protein
MVEARIVTADASRHSDVPEELRRLARQVRAIGDGFRADPEAVYAAKDSVATELRRLARRLEGRS